MISVGSGEEYGPPETVPTTEDAPLRPQNPYAVSKASLRPRRPLLRRCPRPARDPRPRVQPRGPGQEPIYAHTPTFARPGRGRPDAGDDPVRVVSGSPDTRRDFTDVRDIVRAYRVLAEHGDPGTYNVCSGVSRSARELIAALGDVAGVAIDHHVDPAKVRAHEVQEIRGSSDAPHRSHGLDPADPARPDAGRHPRLLAR